MFSPQWINTHLSHRTHDLIILHQIIPWQSIIDGLVPFYNLKKGRTGCALRTLSAVSILARLRQLSDRQVIEKKTGKERVEVVYGVTSLPPERATPERLMELVRGHWAIENQSHWVRDVTFDEDRSQVRCGNIPHVMAALRNTAIGLLRWAGYRNIAKAGRQLAAQPAQALALIGIEREN